METAEFIEILRQDGELLADAAEAAGWDAPVPPCPDWRVRDLVAHLGGVHRWATGFVAGATQPARLVVDAPPDEALASWYRDGHRQLLDRLTAAPADLECWAFLPAPSPLEFWARRQAHETAIHRFDAEAALGKGHSPYRTDFALDGIDELLTGFLAGSRSRLRCQTPRVLRIRAADGPSGPVDWWLRLSQDPPRVERTDGAPPVGIGTPDCAFSGPATALYLALWNRGPYDGIEVTGDGSLAELLRDASSVT
ncbi:maleylpyruvate isomerase family mycothiol-dependent enzyme [Streptomyces silvisoli]|uniref:Maleylpyruvate isomerase family mycothiol-dependent enzyme n=1 Tax=Streptomyces silvisoli TaxID=3034235 RepID=A0ABT5ZK76_9ACTN|nr:maleylpyruvate isomerase family mycothiol-dependent enzyme [Streptomyces silvisoli]MDF3290236.1 maleylpyruvate isomerase family mycothiol-dependent enzyme [Streptomyces silvisoli]